MKKIVILLLFVFITLFTTSCMVGLARDDNYRNDPNYQYNDNNGNYHHRGRFFRNREERHNRHNRENREDQPVLIIR
jgi:hypothetical protein